MPKLNGHDALTEAGFKKPRRRAEHPARSAGMVHQAEYLGLPVTATPTEIAEATRERAQADAAAEKLRQGAIALGLDPRATVDEVRREALGRGYDPRGYGVPPTARNGEDGHSPTAD